MRIFSVLCLLPIRERKTNDAAFPPLGCKARLSVSPDAKARLLRSLPVETASPVPLQELALLAIGKAGRFHALAFPTEYRAAPERGQREAFRLCARD